MLAPVNPDDIHRMRGQLFFEGDARRDKLSRFWLLLALAAIIASAGVIPDSTPTVIGAMIVAPLMTPILGTALAAALADRDNLARSIVLVVTGACLVIAIGWLLGHFTVLPTAAADNTQVAGRVSPRLIDLVAALATGAVGAIALSRSDISDTLPGVAIAISLVPPLAVAGLTLEAGEPYTLRRWRPEAAELDILMVLTATPGRPRLGGAGRTRGSRRAVGPPDGLGATGHDRLVSAGRRRDRVARRRCHPRGAAPGQHGARPRRVAEHPPMPEVAASVSPGSTATGPRPAPRHCSPTPSARSRRSASTCTHGAAARATRRTPSTQTTKTEPHSQASSSLVRSKVPSLA